MLGTGTSNRLDEYGGHVNQIARAAPQRARLRVAFMHDKLLINDLSTVQGSVTFDGQPVGQGSIVFEPSDGVGPVSGGSIEQGRYRLAGDAGDDGR